MNIRFCIEKRNARKGRYRPLIICWEMQREGISVLWALVIVFMEMRHTEQSDRNQRQIQYCINPSRYALFPNTEIKIVFFDKRTD